MLVRNSPAGVNRLSEPRGKVHFLTNLEHDRLLKITRLPTLQLHLAVMLLLATGASQSEIRELGLNGHRLKGGLSTF